MARYGVTLPMAGSVYVEVEAENEDEAVDVALSSDITTDNIEEWEVHRHIVTGNVMHAWCNDPEVEEID